VGRRVTYGFETLTNSTGTDQALTVVYRAIVLNGAGNVGDPQTNLHNSVVFSFDNSSIGPASTTVGVVEPDLTIDKTADVLFISADSEITLDLTITHTPSSQTNAYDVVVEDVLPTGLEYVTGSLDCTLGAQDPDVDCSETDGTIRAEWSNFTLTGGDGQIRFRVRGNSLLPSSGDLTNIGTVAWSSLPGDMTSPVTPNTLSTERHYDPGDNVNTYGAEDPLELAVLGGGGGRFRFPVTGFAPGVITAQQQLPFIKYESASALFLKIPSQNLTIPIVGIPSEKGNWNVSTLWNQAGWLQGTAYPTYNGNSVITSHVVTADGKAGPFARLKQLSAGDQVYITANGYKYIYLVRSMRYVRPEDITILKHQEKPWLTLVTCDKYDEETGTYLWRVVVRAELVQIDQVE
jgi:LPXTG-site transpeptidase (sortase) family protein